MGKWGLWAWSSGLLVWGQLPARYVLKADILSPLWREYRLAGEYRLFRWAPPFIASVERHRWEGLTGWAALSYYRRWPQRGALLRLGARYYPLRTAYTPEGLWVGLHGAVAGRAPRSEPTRWAAGFGLTVGYQHLFHQAYGAAVEPYLLLEGLFGGQKAFSPFQVGLNVGFASRRWDRRNLR
ncbi:MAG: hypothetical protein KatS3mg026_0508 [Bacteroidia bacterium]|nr:MAG: hypothetical protein KatS3mg026_0508 [Bacteroidia bacterium]